MVAFKLLHVLVGDLVERLLAHQRADVEPQIGLLAVDTARLLPIGYAVARDEACLEFIECRDLLSFGLGRHGR